MLNLTFDPSSVLNEVILLQSPYISFISIIIYPKVGEKYCVISLILSLSYTIKTCYTTAI